MATVILRGNIVQALKLNELAFRPHGYLVAEEGRIVGVFDELPQKYAQAGVSDYGDAYITPAFVEMHLHAPQYPMLGMGMDLQLIDWLNTYTFPLEARFSDPGFAREVYRALSRDLISCGTTRVCMFSSLHTDSTLILMEELESAGVTGYVGKVCMDRNGGEGYEETTEGSKHETLRWLDECGRFTRIKPMITPRFTPSCTNELMEWLGKLANERGLPVQSHLSENHREIEWVRELHPDCAEYWQTYDKYGLWKQGTVMGHCVHSTDTERAAMKRAGVTVAHCADSNMNIASGIAPVRKMLEEGVNVALGSDIAGGATLSMLDTAALSVRASKIRHYAHPDEAFLTVKEAFYLITTAGQKYFGAGAGFAPGDELHAVVMDRSGFPPSGCFTDEEQFDRMIYLAKEQNIKAVYSAGTKVK